MEKRRESREFVWPVPPSDLDAIEVFEHADEAVGQERWRRHEETRARLASNDDTDLAATEEIEPLTKPAIELLTETVVEQDPQPVIEPLTEPAPERLVTTIDAPALASVHPAEGDVATSELDAYAPEPDVEAHAEHGDVAALAPDAVVFAPVESQPPALPPRAWQRSWVARAAVLVAVAGGVLLVAGFAITRVPEATGDAGRAAPSAAPAPGATALVADNTGRTTQPTLGLAVAPLKAPAPGAPPADPSRQPAPAAVAPPTASRPAPAGPPGTSAPQAAPTPASGATPTAATPLPPSETPAVLEAVRQYAEAWNRLDARATQAIWPAADRTRLVERFTALREQRLTLNGCSTSVDGARASVSCVGTLRYRPRVGDHTTRVQQGPWRFGLDRSSGAWLIDGVNEPD